MPLEQLQSGRVRLNLVSGSRNNGKTLKVEREQGNISLVGKGKVKKGSNKGCDSKREKKKKYLSKFKCYGHHEFFHYVSDFPLRNKKGKKQGASLADVNEISNRVDREFTLITCLTSSTSQCVWYIDSVVSFHMMGVREEFSNYKEEDINFYIKMGNKSKCTPIA